MSYTVVNPGAKPRPGAVTAASTLLYLCGAIQLASVVVSLLALGPVQDVVREEFADRPEAQTVATATTVGIVVGVSISALLAIGVVVLGLLVGRGKNPARIVTWVIAGIGVLCYGCSLAGTAVQGSLAGLGSDPQSADIQQRITDAIPAWQSTITAVASIIVLIALLAVIVLLALPASNDYFRKEQEVWTPPTWPGDPAGGYPAPPPYPTQPPQPPGGPPQP